MRYGRRPGLLARLLALGLLGASGGVSAAALPPAVIGWGGDGPVQPENVRHFHGTVRRALDREWRDALPPARRDAVLAAQDAIAKQLGRRARWSRVPRTSVEAVVAAHNRVVELLELPAAHRLRCAPVRATGTHRKELLCTTGVGRTER